MRCHLCNSEAIESVQGRVRDRPEVAIRRCTECGLVFLDSFSHVHDSFYEADYTEENHSTLDWQAFLNGCLQDDERRYNQLRSTLINRTYLDVGCGAGGVLLKARGVSKNVTGVEPQSRWRDLLLGAGINTVPSLRDVADAGYDVISLFHVLEHIPEPVPFLKELLSKCSKGGRIFIEVPNADDALLSLYRNKAFMEYTYWSPHLFLYSQHTLARLLEKAGVARERFTITQFQRFPLANHLMWLAEGLPGGHSAWSFLDSPGLNEAYSASLARLGRCDTVCAWIEA